MRKVNIPLHLAAELGSLDAGKLLVTHGADAFERQSLPGEKSRHGDSNLDSKAEPDVEYPPEDDASPESKLTSQKQKHPSPFDIVFDKGHGSLVKVFIKHSLPLQMDASREWHMLWFMAKAFVQDWKGVLEAFHEVGWDLSRRHFYYKRSLLYYVVEHAECIGPVDILLDSGADLSPCSDGSVVKRLIAAGARVRAKDRGFGGTPLVGAIQGGKTANARVLLEAGSDVNHVLNVDGKRRTLLHLAAQDGILEMMQLLLDWKANPNILDEMGGSPAQWAARDNHAEAVRILLAGGLDPNFDKGYSLRIALSLGHLEVAKLLLQHGAKVDLSVITAARDKTVYKGDRIPFFQLCVENIKHNDCETNSSRAYIDLNDKFTLEMGAKNLHIPTIMNGRHGRPNDFRLAAAFVKHGVGTGLADLEEVSRALLICICAQEGFF
ncbi:ankyrin repeat and SAM domain-containing protein [Ilyonectria robusta]